MIEFPYGIADFRRIHLRYADAFDEIFGGLAIAEEPTALANRDFVLQWNFARIMPRGGVDEIAESLRRHVRTRTEVFPSDCEGFLEASIRPDDEASDILDTLFAAIRRTPYRLYLLIDDDDNFVHEIMTQDVETYRALFAAGGPFKELRLIMSQSNQHRVPTFRQILAIDPFVFLCTVFGCGGSGVIVPIFLYLHFSGPRAWLETAGIPMPNLEVVGITLLLALLPLLATMPFAFRRTANIRRVLQASEEVPGKIHFVKETAGLVLVVLFTYKYQRSEQIRRVSVRKRRAVQEILRTGQEIRVLVDRNDPRRVLIKDVFDLTLEERS